MQLKCIILENSKNNELCIEIWALLMGYPIVLNYIFYPVFYVHGNFFTKHLQYYIGTYIYYIVITYIE